MKAEPGNKEQLKCPDCKIFVSAKTRKCSRCKKVINLKPKGRSTMAPIKNSEKKDLVTKATESLRGTLTAGTKINMDFRGANLAGTGQKFKALVVKDEGIVNISKDMALALCARPSRDGLTLILNGTDAPMLADNAVEMLGKALFNDGDALACIKIFFLKV